MITCISRGVCERILFASLFNALRTLLLSPLFNTGTYNFFVITTPILGKVLSMYRNAPELKKLLKLCRKLTSLHGLNNLVLHNYGNIYKKIFFSIMSHIKRGKQQ